MTREKFINSEGRFSPIFIVSIEMRNLKVVIGHVRNAALPNSPKEKREERSVTKVTYQVILCQSASDVMFGLCIKMFLFYHQANCKYLSDYRSPRFI